MNMAELQVASAIPFFSFWNNILDRGGVADERLEAPCFEGLIFSGEPAVELHRGGIKP